MGVVVAAGSQIAAEAGARMGAEGGNAIDSAVAAIITSLCTEPGVVAPGAGAYLTIWPDQVAQPNASSLNPSPGQPPIPNAVTTPLSGAGRFNVFNYSGSVQVIAIDLVPSGAPLHCSAGLTLSPWVRVSCWRFSPLTSIT